MEATRMKFTTLVHDEAAEAGPLCGRASGRGHGHLANFTGGVLQSAKFHAPCWGGMCSIGSPLRDSIGDAP